MNGHRRIALLAASAALAITTIAAGSAFAAPPSMHGGSGHANLPAIDCGDFWVWGEWDLTFATILSYDRDGNLTGALERITYSGRFYNPDTQVSVADRGSKRFIDTFTADGLRASTIFTHVRIDEYVGEAGRIVMGPEIDYVQEELSAVGTNGFTEANLVALCAALRP